VPEVDVNGETLHYERAGSGPPLLLIHSLGTGAWMWRDQIARWHQHLDVVAFDLRGHGRSSGNGEVTVSNIAADLDGALQTLGLRQVTAIGISMGGPIAAHLHARNPDCLSRLVIADSFATQGEAGIARVAALENVLRTSSMTEYGRSYAEGTLRRTTASSSFDELSASVAAMSKETYLQIARSVFTSDVSEFMRAIRIPVRVVVGVDDTRTPPQLSEDIHRLIAGSEFGKIPDAAHLANIDNPEGFHAAVEDFVLGDAPGKKAK